MFMKMWKKTTYVTRGPDPTQVVIWTYQDAERSAIQEFQMIYQGSGRFRNYDQNKLKQLHTMLEDSYQKEMDAREQDSYNYDAKIYGHP